MIELSKLTKIYHSESEGSLALKDISIKFPETGFVAITGESGSGKTTLLNVLSGFVTYEEGSMSIDGVDFSTFSEEDIETYRKNDVGFVFQDYHLIDGHTVLDNLIEALLIVGVPYKAAKKKSLEYLDKIGLLDHKKAKARELSSGQKQKLAIARALIKEPKIILCDEPTANLDGDSGIAIFNLLKEYSQDHLVVVTTHNYEDAKDYVTHFIRLYLGKLTSFEEINQTKSTNKPAKEDKNSDYSHLSFINLKSQVGLNAVKVVFTSILVFLSLFMLALFTGNIDDSFTKVISRSVFNNVTQNEMLVMKKNGEYFSNDDILTINNVNHVEGSQLYGLATEMNYYYRDEIDYGYDIEIVKTEDSEGKVDEHTEHVFKTLQDALYVKSAAGIIDQSDLTSGQIPTDFFDIAVFGNYQIGDTITIYFRDRILQGYSMFRFDFKVSGLLKEDHNVLFSDDFVRNIDYIQYYSNTSPFSVLLNYKVPDRYRPDREKDTYSFYDFEPIYNPNIGANEVQLSSTFVKNAKDLFPSREKITSCSYSCINVPGQSYKFDFAEQLTADELPAFCVYVGSDIYHLFIDSYQSKISRLIIDNYANIDDVILSMTNLKYDCLSEYRSASNTYDADKRDQRAITLVVSLITLIVEMVVFYVFGFFMEKSRLSVDHTLHLLGASRKSIYISSLIQMGIVYTIGLILGIGLYFITPFIPIQFLQNTNAYLRFSHFVIVVVVELILTFLLWMKYRQDFLRFSKKGGRI